MMLSENEFLNHYTQSFDAINKILSSKNTKIIISSIQSKDESYKILSEFSDGLWQLPSNLFVPNHCDYFKVLNFQKIPKQFQLMFKVVCFKYYVNGREGSSKPRGSTVIQFFKENLLFLRYLNKLKVTSLREITELMCSNYVHQCRNTLNRNTKKNLLPNTLHNKFSAIEALFELSQNTFDSMPHPWPNTSATFLSGIETGTKKNSSTQSIPEHILSAIFFAAVTRIGEAETVLSLRDEIESIKKLNENFVESVICEKVNRFLKANHHEGGLQSFNTKLSQLMDSCLIIVLITSGIRIHELAGLKTDCIYTSLNHEHETYYWMKGTSEKTHKGITEWLVTEITHTAIKTAVRITIPLQKKLQQQIDELSHGDATLVNKLQRHKNYLFLNQKNKHIRTLSSSAIRDRINKFAKIHNINWNFTPHQFRRTFAVYAAHSAYGDLRYLRQHFKHWSLDMTALYALNEQQDLELYDEIMGEIKNEKISIVEHWLDKKTIITGGMSEQVISFRNSHDAVRTYPSRRDLAEKVSEQIHIRATSIAWCTADAGGCSGGKMIEKTRCGVCSHAVIDDRKKEIWKRIYKQQLELRDIQDIGASGKARIERDIKRCEDILKILTPSSKFS
ncbi:TPA: tyrosine-type recombinase/integrase [Legionella pneumophila]